MLRKIQRKAAFLSKLLGLSADFGSALVLLREFARLTLERYIGIKHHSFSCRVKVGNKTALMHFTGTMGEILTLVDIFADHSYAPKHGHAHTLFPEGIRTVLDLGANIGIASVWFALAYPDAVVHAYEPNPEMYALLKKNLAQFPRAKTFEQAIADAEGTVTFNQSLYSLESSMYPARNSISISVPGTTIDTAIERIGGQVDLMKIDIEGAEFDALRVSKKLNAVRAVIGEAHTEQSGHPQEELLDLLSNFTVIEIYNPNQDTVFGFYAAQTNL